MNEPGVAIAPETETTPSVSTIASQGVHEFIRYFVASLAALAVDIGILWFLTSAAGLSYLISGAIAFIAGLAVVYLLSVYWVFSERAVRNRGMEFLLFALIGIVGLILNEAILYALTTVLGIFYLVSKIASVIVVFSWNFAARKWILFRSHA